MQANMILKSHYTENTKNLSNSTTLANKLIVITLKPVMCLPCSKKNIDSLSPHLACDIPLQDQHGILLHSFVIVMY